MERQEFVEKSAYDKLEQKLIKLEALYKVAGQWAPHVTDDPQPDGWGGTNYSECSSECPRCAFKKYQQEKSNE